MWNYAIHTASVHLVLGSESLGTSAAPVDCDHKCQDPRGHYEGYYYVGWGGPAADWAGTVINSNAPLKAPQQRC